MEYQKFKLWKADQADAAIIWEILQFGIEQRSKDGSDQWQNGYPNPETVKNDIENGYGFVLVTEEKVAAYCALIQNNEPAYDKIEGKWLSEGDFLVIHRVAVAKEFSGKGVAVILFQHIENHSIEQNIFSIKVDTNFDNAAMLRILEKLGYTYCGKVQLLGGERLAFEKILTI